MRIPARKGRSTKKLQIAQLELGLQNYEYWYLNGHNYVPTFIYLVMTLTLWYKKEFSLDHVYVNNPATISDVSSVIPTFGDHALKLVKLNLVFNPEIETPQRRNWSGYSAAKISSVLFGHLG